MYISISVSAFLHVAKNFKTWKWLLSLSIKEYAYGSQDLEEGYPDNMLGKGPGNSSLPLSDPD